MMKRLLMVIAAATVATAARSDEAAVRATLQRTFPQSPVQGITKTPVPGVLEAAIEGQVFYITEDGRYFVGGPLIDAKESRNLTEVRLEQINAIPFNGLPPRLGLQAGQGHRCAPDRHLRGSRLSILQDAGTDA